MRLLFSSTAVALVLAAGLSAAQAQTVITPQVMSPATETIQTTQTVRTVRPAARTTRRQVVTTRTVTRQLVPTEIVPAPSVVVGAIPASPRRLYDEVTPGPVVTGSDSYGPPLYDEAVPATAVTVPAPAATASEPFAYRYVYEPDRILVIDPATNLAVQAIPR